MRRVHRASGWSLPLLIAVGDCAQRTEDEATSLDLTGAPDLLVPCSLTRCGAACVDLQSDSHNCGACGNDCTAVPGVVGSAVQCTSGHCDVTNACLSGRLHCSGNPNDGCEADVSSVKSCGSCSIPCSEPTPMCSRGTTGTWACASGCGGVTPDRCAMSCVDTSSDAANCGRCGNVCGSDAYFCLRDNSTSSLGGTFQTYSSGKCGFTNPVTGDCSCPTGTSAQTVGARSNDLQGDTVVNFCVM